MATSVVPALIDALVSALDAALTTVKVYDGFGVTQDPGDYLMVGVADEDNGPEAAATSEDQLAFGSTRPRMESGVIHLCALSWNGNANQKAARDAVYASAAAAANALRTTDSLGVAGVMWLGHGSETRLEQDQAEGGAEARLFFDIAFKATI